MIRFKNWFKNLYENDMDRLERILATMKTRSVLTKHYEIDTLHSIAYGENNNKNNNNNNNNNNSSINNKNNSHNCSEDSSVHLQMKNFYLPDIIINEIVRNYLFEDERMDDGFIKNDNLLLLALVSKQFFKVLLKILNILNNECIEWKACIYLNNKEFNIYRNSFFHFNYELVKSIPYSSSREYLELLFSRVQSFYIKTDEHDIESYDGLSRDLEFPEYRCGVDIRKYHDDYDTYKEGIVSSGYLISLPPMMQSLQSLSIHSFYGYSSNYENFLKDILIKNFKTTKLDNGGDGGDGSCGGGCGGCGGIKNFSIHFCNDWKGEPDYDLSFIVDILKNHSNTLEKVIFNCLDAYNIGSVHFEDIILTINKQSKNKIDWKIVDRV
ncbi:hypothetical protein DDB_G0268390 [Dictyostelium discoideum AX4]|uniref:F-box domain-containing protein n=1 Tax=Dictyostelium discoideum TaxID=44689 RepID=Q55FX1_DICDI|nr:hypothetical protein DDB_G0268390 [Dictyostelium discoideum AX4]EAL73648.1 hypothetical protein DDB_G0268390 [Dictyostelium discoideum AX4]|eukprot:XP_647412.1 hypothetical protein DDB_G0268390 [Dictyostelium discoideum AX4]